MVCFALKFTVLAQLNLGCITSLFGLTSFYIAIIFYYAFSESISHIRKLGIVFMITAGVLISLDKKEIDSESDLTPNEKTKFGLLAILCACCAPVFWTIRTYFLRRLIQDRGFDSISLSIDGQMWMSIIGFIQFLVFLSFYELEWADFVSG